MFRVPYKLVNRPLLLFCSVEICHQNHNYHCNFEEIEENSIKNEQKNASRHEMFMQKGGGYNAPDERTE